MSAPRRETVLVHLASGIGNIVLATPLLIVLGRAGFIADVLIDADYPGVAELLEGWSAVRAIYDGRRTYPSLTSYAHVIAAIPPFYWKRYASWYAGLERAPYRAPDALFYRDEQAYYLDYARPLGCDISTPPDYFVPIAPESNDIVGPTTLVLAPGCKTGEMLAKRWPFFPQLADRFDDVVLIGTDDDLTRFDGSRMQFSDRVRSFVGRLSLLGTAHMIANAGMVVANDSGLGHLAAAVGVPTILLFGPTPHSTLGHLPANVTILRRGLSCEPCWFATRFDACDGDVSCLKEITVEEVCNMVRCHVAASITPAVSPDRCRT